MNQVPFILLSILYVLSLATVDGLFNRLVFREKRRLSYSSLSKKAIYNLWEWKAIGASLLFFLPVILPSAIAYLVGGFSFVALYWIILLLVPWDIIFGVLVFDNWLGDTPSIALPFFGWIRFSLKKVLIIRLGLALILVGLKMRFEV